MMKNPYDDEISFAQLAEDDWDFRKVLKPNRQLDFSDPASVLQLTKSLLKRDFGLKIELPPDRLCPPVPNRLNYLLLISHLISSTTPPFTLPFPIMGLDIGTGASCIYPLLGCASNPAWTFTATDIDAKSLDFAKRNIELNNLDSRITILPTTPDDPLIPPEAVRVGNTLDFCMCNPPFYSSKEELEDGAKTKARPANSVCTGSANEMVVQGGEVAFISRIIEESLTLRKRVRWYTSMVGKLGTLIPLIERLMKEECTNWAVSELVQGAKTRRWVLAWSWRDWRPSQDVARNVGTATLEKKYLSFPTDFMVEVEGKDGEVVGQDVDGVLQDLDMIWDWSNDKNEGVGFASGNVWGRKARRKKKVTTEETEVGEPSRKKRKADDATGVESMDGIPFGFKIVVSLKKAEQAGKNKTKTEVLVRWIKGTDSVLFESFCGMVKRKLAS